MNKTKTDLIREVAVGQPHLTNRQIKQEVRKQGVIVSSSEIINVIGSQKKRIQISGYSVDVKKRAREFLNLVGDYDLARNLLALAETER